jgi:O-acetyl-ADP-ribose deacetylase (regulator of RNase III)
VAAEAGANSIAFPAISTGVYGYPKDEAAHIAVASVRNAMFDFPSITDVIFCCFTAADLEIYQRVLSE